MAPVETRSRVDILLDMRLNIQARVESGTWSPAKAAYWIATVDRKLKEKKA